MLFECLEGLRDVVFENDEVALLEIVNGF